ncbi:MAG: SGNH/GDSL hydrolase family protein [Actinomycetota bacterium]
MERIPELHPKPPGVGLRTVGLVLPGVRRVSAQIRPYTAWWSERNQTALHTAGPLLVVVGDSTAIGIGASAPDRGYVGLLQRSLRERDGTPTPWRVINLAQSGARVADGLDRQLPIVTELAANPATTPTVMVSLIGSNDVVWSKDTTVLRNRLRDLIGRLPLGALVGLVAGGSPRARLANRAIKEAAAEHGHQVVNPWAEPGPPPGSRLAADRFHPNDLGYTLMAKPFARALDAPEPVAETGS